MSGHWHYDDVDLDTCAYAVKNRSATWSVPGRVGENYHVPGRDGTIYNPDKAMDENMLVLAMFAAGAELDGKMPQNMTRAYKVRQHLDTLSRLFGARGLKELVHTQRDDYGRVNMIPNPSFENPGRKVVARENQISNPGAEDSTKEYPLRRNFADNPGMEDGSAERAFRVNLARNPRFAAETDPVVSLTNLVPNPSGEMSLRYWRARTNLQISTSRKARPGGTWPIQGQKSIRAVALADGNTVLEVGSIPVDPTTAYSFSAYVWNRSEETRTYRLNARWFNAAGNLISTSANSDLAITTDDDDRCTAVNVVSPAGAKTATLRVTGVGMLEGEVYYVDGAMCTATTTARAYFDGDTDETDGWRYRWRGDDHESRSQRYRVAPRGWTTSGSHSLMCSTAIARRGSQSARVECVGVAATGTVLLRQTVPGSPAEEGDWLSASISARLHPDVADGTVRTVNVGLRCYDSVGTSLGQVKDATAVNVPDVAIALDSGTWQTITFEAGTAPAGTARACVEVRCGEAWADGDAVYFDTALVENAKKVGDWFDGSVRDDETFQYEWVGQAHWSASEERGRNIIGWTADDGRQYQSAAGMLREYALKLVPNRTPASAERPRITSPALDARPGRTHTLTAWVNPNRTLNFKAGVTVDNAKTWTYGTSTPCPAGVWTRVRLSTLLADTINENKVQLQVSADAAPADADEYLIDAVLFEAVADVRPYFDGESGKRYEWEGDAEHSVALLNADRVDGWTDHGTSRPSLWRIKAPLTQGSYAARAQANEDGTLGVTFGQDGVDDVDDYSFGIDLVARTNARAVVVGIAWHDSAGEVVSESLSTSTSPAVGSVVRKTVTGAVPLGASVGAPFVRISGALAGEVFDFDAAIFGFGGNTAYADGDSGSGWEWFTSADPGFISDGKGTWESVEHHKESRQLVDGVDYWRCDSGGTLVQSALWATSRDESALYTVTGSNPTNKVWAITADDDDQSRFRIIRDQQVSFAVDVRAVDPVQVILQLEPVRWKGHGWSNSTTPTYVGVPVDLAAGTEQRCWITASFATDSGDGSHFYPSVRVRAKDTGANPPAGTRVRFDSATLSRDDHIDYIDGTMQYVTWLGNEDASGSKRVGPARRVFVERKQAIDFTSIGNGTAAEFAVQLIAPDPYWEDTIEKSQVLALPRNGGVLRFDNFVGCTAPIHDAEVTLFGPFSDLTVTDVGTGEWFRINLRVKDNQTIVVDNNEWTVNRGSGKTVIGNVRYSGGTVLIPITVPSDDDVPRLRVHADSIGRGAKMKIRAREKYQLS